MAMILPVAGCTGDGSPTLIPNADPALRRTSTELAADSAKRSYPANAPKEQKAIARADYNLMDRKFDLANTSDSDWKNVEVWINQEYVLSVPIFTRNSAETLNFELYLKVIESGPYTSFIFMKSADIEPVRVIQCTAKDWYSLSPRNPNGNLRVFLSRSYFFPVKIWTRLC